MRKCVLAGPRSFEWVGCPSKGETAFLVFSNPETIMSRAPGLISRTRSVGYHAVIIIIIIVVILYACYMLGTVLGFRHGSTEMWLSRKGSGCGVLEIWDYAAEAEIREASCAGKSRWAQGRQRPELTGLCRLWLIVSGSVPDLCCGLSCVP